MRVHELAKELGIASKDLILKIEKLGGSAKNHMALVDEAILAKLLAAKKSEAPVAVEAAAASKVAKAPVAPKVAPKKEATSHLPKEPAKKEVAAVTPPAASVKPVTPVVSRPMHAQPFIPPPRPMVVKQSPAAAVPPPAAPVAKPAEPVSLPSAVSAPKGIVIRFPVTVGNLAAQLSVKIPDLIKTLMGLGIFANVNQLLNEEIGMRLAGQLGIAITKAGDEEVAEIIQEGDELDAKHLKWRPPVVTMMGHVDHGKTSLLDAIRKTNVVAKEAGQITQHIGAYGVDIPGKGHVTFLDTPGHEAFTAMRARGANVTDIVVLVVAADDGVMPQTVEAADHAREAGCPIVVAINKSDLPSANPQRVMTGLQKIELMPEEWGGKTICIKVSAKTGKGIDELLEMLLLESEILELKANPDRLAVGTVIEGHLSKGSGPVATVIVQKGTLKMADMVVCGPYMGRVRSLKNDRGKTVREAGPSYAAELSGLGGVPEAGEKFFVVKDEKTARKITDQRLLEIREREMRGAPKHLSLEELYHRISEGNFKELKLILKADVQGSIEALALTLEKLSNEKCRIRVIHAGMGGVNESDVMLAAASDAIVIGFHVKADPKAQDLAEKEGVDIRFYSIIYEAADDVKKALEGLLAPTYKEVVEGRIELRKIFESSKTGKIGGGMVIKGKVARSNKARVLRQHVVVFDGRIASLRRFQDDVREVAQGYECGIALEGFNDLREGDLIESYRTDKIATKL